MKVYRNPDAMWREEERFKAQAYEGLEQGADVAEVGTSIILFSGKMHSLNILGTEIWKLCDGKAIEEIVSELRALFDVDEQTLSADVTAFLDHLKEEGLVHEK